MNRPKIRELYFILTHKCNLECKYCFVSQKNETMSCEVSFAGIDYLAKNVGEGQVATVNLFGGEPLLMWSQTIVPTILYAEAMYPGKIKFNMTSNCVLLDKEKSDFLIKHKVGLLTSFDGCKETQDYNRPFHNGEGSYDTVYNNIMAHKENGGFLGTMRSTVHPGTAHLMFENYMQAINMGYRSWFFIPDSFSTYTEQNIADYEKALFKIADHYIDFWKEHNRRPIEISNVEKDLPQALEDLNRTGVGLDLPMRPLSQRCGFGQNFGAALAPTGDIYGCQQMTSNDRNHLFWLGNIFNGGVLEERRDAMLDAFNSEGGRKGDMECENCSGRSICKGGCVATNYAIYGEMRHNSPTWCMNMRTLHKVGMYIVSNLRELPSFREYLTNIAKKNRTVCAVCQENQSKY